MGKAKYNSIISNNVIATFLVMLCVSGCSNTLDRLANVGKPPEFNEISDYEGVEKEGVKKPKVPPQREPYKAENYTTTYTAPPPKKKSNTLWRPGARTFFRDQRARSVGDILKVKITLQDSAKLDNKTERQRSSDSKMGLPNLFGLERAYPEINKAINPNKLIGLNSNSDSSGNGTIDRKENINTTIAAMVVRKIPNGNLFIKGTQEIRVNYELREITVAGIVRPEDINTDNTITLDQIAEARISYGGRGHISDYQQERYGKQVLDIISPF